MRAVYFIQETKNADLTMRQQQLLCLRAARRLRWYCCEAVFVEAGTRNRFACPASRYAGAFAQRRRRRV